MEFVGAKVSATTSSTRRRKKIRQHLRWRWLCNNLKKVTYAILEEVREVSKRRSTGSIVGVGLTDWGRGGGGG